MSHATGVRYLKGGILPHMWCSGCGIGTMLGAMHRAFEELNFTTTDTVVVTGIRCTGKVDDYMITMPCTRPTGAPSYATDIKAFNPKLNVVAIMGDGDSVTIGGNHLSNRDAKGRKQVWSCDVAAPPAVLDTDLAWDREATHMDDRETFLPIAAMRKAVAVGVVAGLARRFHCAPTDYSHRKTMEVDAPEILRRLREDKADAALLVAI